MHKGVSVRTSLGTRHLFNHPRIGGRPRRAERARLGLGYDDAR